MYFINPVITDLAQVKVNEAINANQPLIFTKLSIGKGKQVGDLKLVSSMKTHFMDLNIAKELQGETIKLFSRLSNEGFVDEAHITELGIFAKVGNTGTEFLFMYTCADQGDIIPPANNGAYIRTYRFETTLESDGELTINVVAGEGVYITAEEVEQMIESLVPSQIIYDDSVTESTLPSYFEPGKTTITQNKISDDIWWTLGRESGGRAQLVITSVGPEGVASQLIISGGSIFTRVDGFGDNKWGSISSPLVAANNYYDYLGGSALTSKQLKDYMKSTASAQHNSAIADIPKASTVVNGLMSKEDKFKLGTIENGAQINPTVATQAQAEGGTDNTTTVTPLRVKQAITKQAMVVVNHGTNASTARPSGALAVYWIGSVEPTKATDNDLWIGG